MLDAIRQHCISVIWLPGRAKALVRPGEGVIAAQVKVLGRPGRKRCGSLKRVKASRAKALGWPGGKS